MSETMMASIYHEKKTITIEEKFLPELQEGWALIKVEYSGICGTDLNIYGGGHPRAKGPLVMGHEFTGSIEKHPTLSKGTLVTVRPILSCGVCEACQTGNTHVCENLRLIGIDRDGAMAQYVTAPVDEVIPLPLGISTKIGALVEPFAVTVHAVRESSFKPGDDVIVFGAGPIGLCMAITLKLLGARKITIYEVQPYRSSIAKSLGFNVKNPIDECGDNNSSRYETAHIVYDCAAHPSVASMLVDVTKVKGEIVLVGTYKNPTPIDLQNITFKEITLRGTRVYTKRDFDIAIDMLTKEFPFEKIITHVVPLEKLQDGFQTLLKGDAIKILVDLNMD